ncbi:hypothetical protein ACIBL3_44555 [Kribbella sp. NPDC050124]|uniref:hypothetical protein n=1 Tax=Kribbella sp. NPDC050124 TaxID=3364114 RepID=UPI0037AB007C
MNRPSGRTEECNRPQAAVRLTHARAFLEVADLVGDVDDELANENMSAALAVLAGIAAADAACWITLGQRSRGQDHRQAINLVTQVGSDGQRLGPERSKDCSTSGTARTTARSTSERRKPRKHFGVPTYCSMRPNGCSRAGSDEHPIQGLPPRVAD